MDGVVTAHTAVILGLGSIGGRHARLLLERPNWRVLAIRSGFGQSPAPGGVVEVADLDAAVAAGADVAFICSPTHLHVDQAREAARRGLHLFIEKPLGNSSDGLRELLDLVAAADVRVLIGMVLRHHPLIGELAAIASSQEVFHVRAECSSWLPNWRTGLDYRASYSAHADQGGGVVLDLMHEIDLVEFLIGPITAIDGTHDHRSQLETDSSDHAQIRLVAERATAEVFLSAYSRLPQRWITVYGQDTTARLDLLRHELVSCGPSGEVHRTTAPLERDDLYRRQIYHLEQVLPGAVPVAPAATAVRLLTLLDQGGLL